MSLLAIFIFVIAPFISIPFIIYGIIKDKKHSFIYCLLLAGVFAIISYNFNPKIEQDLYRYYFEMDNYYSKINLMQFMNGIFNGTKIIFNFLQFLFAQIGNFRLLPFVCTFIGYFISFYIIVDYAKIKNVKSWITLTVLGVFNLTFYHINFMSGLAQYLAILVAFLGFYLEFIKGKNKILCVFLYIIPIFIHISLIIVPLLRIGLMIDFKKIRIPYIILLIIYSIFPIAIYYVLDFIPAMDAIAYKINAYMVNGVRLNTTYDFATLALILFYMFIFYTSKKKLKQEFPEKLYNCMEITLLFNLFSCVYRDIFSRVLILTMLFFSIFFLVYFSKCEKKSLKVTIAIMIVFCGTLGSVNINNIVGNDYNDVFKNSYRSVFYLLKDEEWKINDGS